MKEAAEFGHRAVDVAVRHSNEIGQSHLIFLRSLLRLHNLQLSHNKFRKCDQ
jgi:hypothetical protein